MFDPRREERNNPLQPNDHLRPKNGDPYFGWKIRKETQNYENYMKWNGGGVEFRPDVKEDEHGICSPPLWEKQSAPVVHSQQFDNVSLNLSPTSRREAVNKGRLELMEMVKAMPESSYELSLKDLVDNFQKPEENECLKQESVKKVKRKAKMGRSVSNINENNKGLFLKMVLPLPFGGSSKKKVTNPYARVLMSKPFTTEEEEVDDRGFNCVDKDWWKKRSSVSDENQSGGSTRSNSTRNKNGCLHGFSALCLRKSKSAR